MSIEDFGKLECEEILADLCIVGSGPAGWTIAEEVRRTGIRIVVVESGGTAFDPGAQALNDIDVAGESLFNGRTRILGGTSHAWSGRCISFDEIDYEQRPWVPNSGWPFGRATIAPYLDRAAAHLGAGPYDRDGRAREPDGYVKRPLFDPNLLRNVCWDDPQPVHFGERFAARPSANVRVILNATVTHVNTNELGTRVESVEIAHSYTKRAVVRARTIVLCAGGIENARILLYSNRTFPAGLGNQHDLVGRFFMDHPRDLDMTVRFDARDAMRIRSVFGKYALESGRGKHFFAHGVALSPDLQRREELLNCAAWPIHDIAVGDPVEAAKRILRGPRSGWRDDAQLVVDGRRTLLEALPVLRARLAGERRAFPRATDRVGFFIGSEQVPDRESRIRLGERRDRFGLPIAEITWRIGPHERASQAALARIIANEFRRLGLPAATLADWVTSGRYTDATLSDGCHSTGTTRMSANARTGVVDADCRVHGIDGLYVAGSSIFPTAGHANPTLMLVAFAVRLGAHLRDRFAGAHHASIRTDDQRRPSASFATVHGENGRS